jgi:hypothetical protein
MTRFYARLFVLRAARDAVLFASILTLEGAHWLDRHRLF